MKILASRLTFVKQKSARRSDNPHRSPLLACPLAHKPNVSVTQTDRPKREPAMAWVTSDISSTRRPVNIAGMGGQYGPSSRKYTQRRKRPPQHRNYLYVSSNKTKNRQGCTQPTRHPQGAFPTHASPQRRPLNALRRCDRPSFSATGMT